MARMTLPEDLVGKVAGFAGTPYDPLSLETPQEVMPRAYQLWRNERIKQLHRYGYIEWTGSKNLLPFCKHFMKETSSQTWWARCEVGDRHLTLIVGANDNQFTLS